MHKKRPWIFQGLFSIDSYLFSCFPSIYPNLLADEIAAVGRINAKIALPVAIAAFAGFGNALKFLYKFEFLINSFRFLSSILTLYNAFPT